MQREANNGSRLVKADVSAIGSKGIVTISAQHSEQCVFEGHALFHPVFFLVHVWNPVFNDYWSVRVEAVCV